MFKLSTQNVDIAKKMKFRKLVLLIVITSTLLFLIGSYAYATTAPDPPTGLSAIPISPTTVSLSWTPPQHNGSSPITGYILYWKIAGSTYNQFPLSNVTKYNQTNLITGKTYIYRVSAKNAIGESTLSTPEQEATPKSTSGPLKNIPPNPPSSLVATPYSATQINLSWNPPADNGGYHVTGYRIQYGIDSGSFANLTANTGNTNTAYSHTGLSTSHTYTYRVFAINQAGISTSSNTASTAPTVISSVPSSPIGLVASTASTTSIRLSWNPPQNSGGSAILGYKIEYRNGSSTYTVLVANTGSSATSYMHTGLKTGTTYTYHVSAINSLGTGTPSSDASATPTKTYTPTGVTAIAVSPTRIDLSWIPPTETYGSLIMGYKIEQKLSSNAYDTIEKNTGQITSYSVTGLKTGKTYTFSVTALYSGGGESNPSSDASATPTSTSTPPSSPPPVSPPSQTPSLPDPPTGLNATIISQTSVKLSWRAPANIGKPAITGYEIEYKTVSGSWLVLVANAGSGTSYLQTGWAPGTYYYRVSSLSSAGTSSPSTTVSVTIMANNQSPPPPPVIQSSGGSLPVTNTEYSVTYNALGGKVLGISADQATFSLNMQMTSTSDGVLSLDLPRDLIDAKKSDGTDDDYIVVTGKQVLLKFNETKTSSDRNLAINFPAGTSEITIYGTRIIPEFPISALVLVIALVPVIFFSRKNH